MTYPIWRFEHVRIYNVVDGDTVDIEVDLGFSVKLRHRFRLARINTPERGQPGYQEAKDYLQLRCFGHDCQIDSTKLDKYGRYLCEIFIEGVNINDEMLLQKLAALYL